MLNRGKKGLAMLLSTVFAVAAVAGAFPVVTFAQDEPTQAVVVQQEGEAASADLPGEEPQTEEEAAPEPEEQEEPAGEPEIDPAALPQGEELKETIRTLLANTRDMAALSEEELDQTAQEIEALAVAPVSADEAGDEELTELFARLADAQAAVEDMRMAYEAAREGWLDQLPQTGLENSWRYQNGRRVDAEDNGVATLSLPDGVSTFSANGHWGIDVSRHQGTIDWKAVKNAGVEFAVIRCGYGDDETDQDDSQWERNVSQCEKLGIPYGVYLYSYATSTSQAASEGRHAVRLLKGHSPTLPVFYDLEENRQLSLGNSGLADLARTFADIVSNAGYEVGVYASRSWWNNYLTDSVFENWYRWVAEWRSSCSYGGRYEMWQYASDGSVSGVSGNVDMDYWYGSLSGKDNQPAAPSLEELEAEYAPVYNYEYYVTNNKDLAGYTRQQAMDHFLNHGMAEGRQACEEFNVRSYRARYYDLMDWLGNDLKPYYIHYKDHGKAEGRDAKTYCRLTRYNKHDYGNVYDFDYYTAHCQDIRDWVKGDDYLAIQHFVEYGMAEGRQGCEEFNVRNYRARYYDLMDWLGNDLKPYYLHYQDYGKAEGRDAKTYCRLTRYNKHDYGNVYDFDYYTAHCKDIRDWVKGDDYLALQHFVEYGMAEGRQACEEFNVRNYRARYYDLMDWLGDDLKPYYLHYQDYGKKEGRDAKTYCRLTRYNKKDYSAVYDFDYYIAHCKDIRDWVKGNDYMAIQHFVEYGMAEGRQGSEEFNVYTYRARYDDLRKRWGNDLKPYYLHYINEGKQAGLKGV